MTRSDTVTLYAAGAVLLVAVLAYRRGAALLEQAAPALEKVGAAINPANPDNIVNRAVTAGVSAVAGRDTSPGSLVADILPSAAEREVNRPGFWVNARPERPSLFNFWDSGETAPEPFTPPGFVGTLPADPERPAIIYRTGRRAP